MTASSTGARRRTFIASLRREWRAFHHDRVGHRFRNHRRRLRTGSMKLRAASVVLAVFLIAIGIVLCFIPGPGLLVIVFGLALLAGESRALAGWLDRAEPKVRRRALAV